MRARTKTVIEVTWLKLVQHTNANTKRRHYSVVFTPWKRRDLSNEDVRALFDPGKCRGSQYGTTWKFRNKHEAEQLIMTAVLKWGA